MALDPKTDSQISALAPVQSVAGRTGAVTLSTTDISGLGTAATQPSSAFDPAGIALALVTAHESDTTSVHGIADTSTLYRSGGTDVAVSDGGTGASTASGARAALGLVIGTDVLSPSGNGSALTGLVNTQVSGLGTLSTQAASAVAITGGSITGITDLTVADGGTGASTAAAARTNLGLVIGTDVLAPNGSGANLTSLQGLTEFSPIYADSGTWLFPPGGANATIALVANTKYLMPIFIKNDRTFIRLAIAVTTFGALSNCRAGIRRAAADGSPTTLLHEIATPFDCTSIGLKQATISQTLTAGMWWLELCPSVACTIVALSTVGVVGVLGRSHSGSNSIPIAYLSRAYTYAALPADETGVSQTPSYGAAANVPGVALR